jgi:mRNA interferase MazF
MPDSADVVTMEFRGAQTRTRRPAIVVSSAEYHHHRPDIVVGIVTTNVSAATTPTDHALRDWRAAGLRQPSAFRCYLNTVLHRKYRLSAACRRMTGEAYKCV